MTTMTSIDRELLYHARPVNIVDQDLALLKLQWVSYHQLQDDDDDNTQQQPNQLMIRHL